MRPDPASHPPAPGVGSLPVGPGDQGEAVRDIQHRLTALGFDVAGDESGSYGPATESAVKYFQEQRGLRVDGICGRDTWSSLVEAGYALGNRLLYLRQPMLRGDDVGGLQRRLSSLGFDAGRIDGMFGPETGRALEDFQRNAGLTVDGVCGPATLAALERFGSRREGAASTVAAVREAESLRRAPRTLVGLRVVVGQGGGLDALARALARRLTHAGAIATVSLHPDGSEQAAEANAAGAHVFVGVELDPDDARSTTAYYARSDYESAGGRHLAELVQDRVPGCLGVKDGGIRGMSVPALRETRMPAIVCEVGPATVVVERMEALAAALGAALAVWRTSPPT